MTDADRQTVLVVEDEKDLADLYATWLAGEYEVRTAYDAETALELVDDDVDVALLDRRMPGTSGDELLAAIRDMGVDCHVAMVTAVDPDFDIVEMPFDTYLVKPVTREDLTDTVERLLRRSEFDDRQKEYFSLAERQAALQSEKTERELEQSEEYRQLTERIAEIRAELDGAITEFEDDDFELAFRDLESR
ncbi:HalX domain-containing protein [Halobacteriaceae archaeon GCM10025711]